MFCETLKFDTCDNDMKSQEKEMFILKRKHIVEACVSDVDTERAVGGSVIFLTNTTVYLLRKLLKTRIINT